MIELDGSDGGGQVVRSAVALSTVTGEAVEIDGVRGDRPDPGLKAQHLTAVETAAAITDAAVDGLERGSESLSFDPGRPSGGTYGADVGTAGSLTLVFDTVLPLATALDAPLTLTATGGTDVKWSPPTAHYRRVKLPLLRRYGLAAAVDRRRPGFYPAGGGEATLSLGPSALRPLSLDGPGAVDGARVHSLASADLAEADVARRQADAAAERLADAGTDVLERRVTVADADSTGSAVTVRLDCGGSVAGFDALGEPGTPAGGVADRAVDGAVAFADHDAPVDAHLGDQLLVFLAVAGGRVRVPELTAHVETSLALIEAFGIDVDRERRPSGALLRADGVE